MSKYEKPVVMVNEEVAEGVYAASGCYDSKAEIHQKPETGRGDYRIQVDGDHIANHTSDSQTVTVTFNQPVTYNGVTSNVITFEKGYHQNPTGNIGFGDLIVESEAGLEIIDTCINCNHAH